MNFASRLFVKVVGIYKEYSKKIADGTISKYVFFFQFLFLTKKI